MAGSEGQCPECGGRVQDAGGREICSDCGVELLNKSHSDARDSWIRTGLKLVAIGCGTLFSIFLEFALIYGPAEERWRHGHGHQPWGAFGLSVFLALAILATGLVGAAVVGIDHWRKSRPVEPKRASARRCPECGRVLSTEVRCSCGYDSLLRKNTGHRDEA